MDRITKVLKKLDPKERKIIKDALVNIRDGNFEKLSDIKKLKGHSTVYRVRKSSIRIIYKTDKNEKIKILAIERRSEKTYKL